MTTQQLQQSFRDRHGVEIAFRRWAARTPRACVVIAHGASEHSGRYDRFGSALAADGLAAYAIDHRGHGQTAASTGPGRIGVPGGEALVDDLDALIDIATAENPGTPVFLFGHSMGSLIALSYATRHASRLHGLILCGFAADPDVIHDIVAMFPPVDVSETADQPAPSLTGFNAPFEPARTPYDWLSRDPVEVDRYIADPLCGDDLPLTIGFTSQLLSLVGTSLAEDALATIACPVLLIAGDRDPAAGMGSHVDHLQRAMRKAQVDVTSRLYSGARHELLNETNRDEVTADVIGWLHAQRTGRTS